MRTIFVIFERLLIIPLAVGEINGTQEYSAMHVMWYLKNEDIFKLLRSIGYHATALQLTKRGYI